MANAKRSLLSSLFGRGKNRNKGAEEAAELEAKLKLEARIQEVLAVAEAPKLFAEEEQVPLTLQEEEAESVAEILPITASALNRRKISNPATFLPPQIVEVEHRYVANDRW